MEASRSQPVRTLLLGAKKRPMDFERAGLASSGSERASEICDDHFLVSSTHLDEDRGRAGEIERVRVREKNPVRSTDKSVVRGAGRRRRLKIRDRLSAGGKFSDLLTLGALRQVLI